VRAASALRRTIHSARGFKISSVGLEVVELEAAIVHLVIGLGIELRLVTRRSNQIIDAAADTAQTPPLKRMSS
jgi:hypothetical protein